jgi:hypothetical protein
MNRDTMNNEALITKTLALAAAWLVAGFSFLSDFQSGTGWFPRSGSILVLVAIITGYQLMATRSAYHNKQLAAYKDDSNIDFLQSHPSTSHRKLEIGAHITAVIGTLIWGYGDLIV